MRVGYLGPPGTFTHEAITASGTAPGTELVAMPTIYDTILGVHDGELDRGLVPLENSLEGSVNVTLDALALEAGDVEIIGEVVHPIRHCLLARGSLELAAVRAVVSHPQASAQCARFIRTHLPYATVVAATSTAEAVRRVAEGGAGDADGPWAALGTRAAGELYGCVVLRDGVEDRPGNETRFVLIARRGATAAPRPDTAGYKTSLVFWDPGADTPGWLVRCLSEFAFRGVNLTRIESRPLKDGLGRYMFFLDCQGAVTSPVVAEAVTAVRAHAQAVRVLGSYRAAN
jgi:prephenate dehydratase